MNFFQLLQSFTSEQSFENPHESIERFSSHLNTVHSRDSVDGTQHSHVRSPWGTSYAFRRSRYRCSQSRTLSWLRWRKQSSHLLKKHTNEQHELRRIAKIFHVKPIEMKILLSDLFIHFPSHNISKKFLSFPFFPLFLFVRVKFVKNHNKDRWKKLKLVSQFSSTNAYTCTTLISFFSCMKESFIFSSKGSCSLNSMQLRRRTKWLYLLVKIDTSYEYQLTKKKLK